MRIDYNRYIHIKTNQGGNKLKRLTAFLLAGVTVLSLTGCVPRYADTAAVERRNTRPTTVVTQQPTDVMTGENAESTPVPTEEPIIEKPENVVFAENNTARIQMPSDTLTVTFEGKDIKPCNDSVGTLQQAYDDLFTDNSHLNFSRWVLEYAIGENQELVIHGPGGIYKSDALPNANNIIPTFFQFGGLRNLQAEGSIQFMFLGITENATFDDVLKTMSQYGEPVSGWNYDEKAATKKNDLTGTLNYWTDSGYNIEFYFDNYGTSLTMVSIAYNPEELANLSK